MNQDKFVPTNVLVASKLRKQYGLKPVGGKKCYLSIETESGKFLNEQKIEIVFIPSSLGRGFIALLIGPISGKRCRKLHFINGKYQYNLNQKNFYSFHNPLKYSQPAFYKACLSIQANQEL